jgi:endonuclease/exonuclease/phosphatase family metal-dependent hydrolase
LTETPPTVRVLTWNIHGALGRNRRFDIERVVELIDRWDPQVVALQEVDSRRDKSSENPFELLQRELGEHGIGAKSITTADGDYGQMLISRWPMNNTVVHDLSHPEREPRRAIVSTLATPHGPLRFVATHLGLSVHERRGQARKLLEIAGQGGPTTIVAGDFNDWFWPGSVRGALSHELPGRTLFRTYPSAWPCLRLDGIYCRPRDALVQCFTDREARHISDHLPVIADVRVEEPKSERMQAASDAVSSLSPAARG